MTTRMSPFERRENDIEPRNEASQLTTMIDANMSRRNFLGAASVMNAGAFMAGMPVSALANNVQANSKLMGFSAVPISTDDTVVVPDGYNAKVLIRWGDGLFPTAPQFDPTGNAPSSHQGKYIGLQPILQQKRMKSGLGISPTVLLKLKGNTSIST